MKWSLFLQRVTYSDYNLIFCLCTSSAVAPVAFSMLGLIGCLGVCSAARLKKVFFYDNGVVLFQLCIMKEISLENIT